MRENPSILIMRNKKMGTLTEILEIVGNLKGTVSITALIYSLLFVAMVIMAFSLKKRGLRTFRTAVPILILFFLALAATTGYMISRNGYSAPDPNSFTREAKVFLTSIADAQVLYFAEHNKWAGYPDSKIVFKSLGWRPGGSTHYAYYCGYDYMASGRSEFEFNYPDPAVDWPYGVYPDITISDFTCMAIANNDRDAFPDVWMINKFKKPTHLLDDATNKVLVDIVSEPFDAHHFYTKALDNKSDRKVSRVYIEINIPAYRLDLYEDGRYLKSYPVAVGMLSFKTPRRNFYMERMEWNPWWIPPNAAWCKKKTIDEEGNEKIEGCKPVSPGPWNPLGPVKMILQSSFLIHGTNKPKTIGHRASHGCIRMYSDNASDLAWKIMVLAGTKQPLVNQELYRTKSRKTFRVSANN